jgi:chemotaxis protein histidine kinase CheA
MVAHSQNPFSSPEPADFIDLEEFFSDALAEAQAHVQSHTTRVSLRSATGFEIPRLAVAPPLGTAPRSSAQRTTRQLEWPELESLFLNLSPLQLEEWQLDERSPDAWLTEDWHPHELVELPQLTWPPLRVSPPQPLPSSEYWSEPLPAETSLPNLSLVDTTPLHLVVPDVKDPELPPGLAELPTALMVNLGQLEELQYLVGELFTQDQQLNQQQYQLQADLQTMLGDFSDLPADVTTQTGQVSVSPQVVTGVKQLQQQLRYSQQTLKEQRQSLRRLHYHCRKLQMQPLVELLDQLTPLIKDQANSQGKQITWQFSGTATLVDRRLTEQLYYPLSQLIWLAITHEIESPIQRQALGKPETALFQIWGYSWGHQVCLELRHDGQALAAESLPPAFALVADLLQDFQGTLQRQPLPSGGVSVTLRLPRFVAVANLLLLRVRSQRLAVPLDTLRQVVVASSQSLVCRDRQWYYLPESHLPQSQQSQPTEPAIRAPQATDLPPLPARIPVYRLRDLLNYPAQPVTTADLPTHPEAQGLASQPLLLITLNQQTLALGVDELLTEQELAIKPIPATPEGLAAPSYIWGCALLPKGETVPILDPALLLAELLSAQPVTLPE